MLELAYFLMLLGLQLKVFIQASLQLLELALECLSAVHMSKFSLVVEFL